MKTRSILGVILLSGLILSGPAFAEHADGDWAEKKIERLKEKLSLTEAQTAQVRSILETKAQTIKQAGQQAQEQISALLTEDQRKIYEGKKGHGGHKDACCPVGKSGKDTAATPDSSPQS